MLSIPCNNWFEAYRVLTRSSPCTFCAFSSIPQFTYISTNAMRNITSFWHILFQQYDHELEINKDLITIVKFSITSSELCWWIMHSKRTPLFHSPNFFSHSPLYTPPHIQMCSWVNIKNLIHIYTLQAYCNYTCIDKQSQVIFFTYILSRHNLVSPMSKISKGEMLVTPNGNSTKKMATIMEQMF